MSEEDPRSPYKVYNPQRKFEAACVHPEIAGALVAFLGDGATIRYDHQHVVWDEGQEVQPAAESYDFVAETVARRVGFLAIAHP